MQFGRPRKAKPDPFRESTGTVPPSLIQEINLDKILQYRLQCATSVHGCFSGSMIFSSRDKLGKAQAMPRLGQVDSDETLTHRREHVILSFPCSFKGPVVGEHILAVAMTVSAWQKNSS
jgi:hypothetical protein